MRLDARTRVGCIDEARAALAQFFGVKTRLLTARHRKTRRRAHVDQDLFDRRKLGGDGREDARCIMRLDPHLEKFGRHREMGGIIGQLHQLQAQKPGAISRLAELGLQPAAYDGPILL